MSDIVRDAYRRAWWALVLRGIFALAIGIFILWRPFDSIAAFALLIAWWALFTGVIQVVHSLEFRSIYPHWWVVLLSGAIGIVFGIAALRNYPGLSLAFAVVWVAWWLLLSGAIALYLAFAERRMGLSWAWTLVFGLVCVAAGVFALMSPPATLAAIMGLISFFAIASGVVHLIGAFALSSAKSDVTDRLHGAAA